MFKIKKDPTKVMILATGPGWDLAPKETEKIVYALNDFVAVERYKVMPDFLFLMDILDEKPQVVSGQTPLPDMIRRLNALRVPFLAPFKYEEIPSSIAFPLEAVVKKFGLPYFTNTICYMIAYALLQGAKEIETYGVNQAGSHEYSEEKGGVEYWLGVAIGMGVKVTVHGNQSQLMKYKGRYGNSMLYGYLQNYQEIQSNKERFGEVNIRKLLKPSTPFERKVEMTRQINP